MTMISSWSQPHPWSHPWSSLTGLWLSLHCLVIEDLHSLSSLMSLTPTLFTVCPSFQSPHQHSYIYIYIYTLCPCWNSKMRDCEHIYLQVILLMLQNRRRDEIHDHKIIWCKNARVSFYGYSQNKNSNHHYLDRQFRRYYIVSFSLLWVFLILLLDCDESLPVFLRPSSFPTTKEDGTNRIPKQQQKVTSPKAPKRKVATQHAAFTHEEKA